MKGKGDVIQAYHIHGEASLEEVSKTLALSYAFAHLILTSTCYILDL